MATPGAPTITLQRGPEPNSIQIHAAAITADPVVTKYTAYYHGKTGVGKAGTNAGEFSSGVPDFVIRGLPIFPELFVAMTATNSEAESTDSSTVSVSMQHS